LRTMLALADHVSRGQRRAECWLTDHDFESDAPASDTVVAKWRARSQIRGSFNSAPFVAPRKGYSPTRNVKLPLTLWVSEDIARHSTV
jgi:hypothetical protein